MPKSCVYILLIQFTCISQFTIKKIVFISFHLTLAITSRLVDGVPEGQTLAYMRHFRTSVSFKRRDTLLYIITDFRIEIQLRSHLDATRLYHRRVVSLLLHIDAMTFIAALRGGVTKNTPYAHRAPSHTFYLKYQLTRVFTQRITTTIRWDAIRARTKQSSTPGLKYDRSYITFSGRNALLNLSISFDKTTFIKLTIF